MVKDEYNKLTDSASHKLEDTKYKAKDTIENIKDKT